MAKIETIADFYREKIGSMPESIRQDIGHFNVLKTEFTADNLPDPAAYRRRDFYKVVLMYGQSELQFADKIVRTDKQALIFINPQIPLSADLSKVHTNYCCVFNQHFFHHYTNLNGYPVYQPGGIHAFELTDEQAVRVEGIFGHMLEEMQSDYVYKYDVLRNYVLELIHFALKMQPSSAAQIKYKLNASERIASLFIELLERHYAIDDLNQRVALRSATDFASHMNIHVNHLNRALKAITGKTTTQLIAERCLIEAKTLLKQSTWNVSEIAYALGFLESAHFNTFFKKNNGMTPLQFRNV
ncbi:helix-turn-helix transcriptional regulator [Chitinophaga sp. 212800010-3]|uniref:helix-turn-helix domain-containing protein n=1 Tax=unclassified Chitinophaga TaxID=2619133 RepID=UPI002DF6AAFF|nr:HTH araC/xylS-type domain-containing protein [Chitinophaga sp. 212800010-3]